MPPALEISDAEWHVMHVLWDAAPRTAAEVIAALEGQVDWSPRTVKTLLHRLVRKGALTFREEGKRYLYRPAVKRETCIRRAGESFLSRVFSGDAVPLVEHFVKQSQLSPEQIAHLKKLLDEEGRRNG